MSMVFGYPAALVLTDNQGRRLIIETVYHSDVPAAFAVDASTVLYAMGSAEEAGVWGDDRTQRQTREKCWRVGAA